MQRNPETDKFLAGIEHPMKAEVEMVRSLILSASLNIQDGVKWNSLSFQTSDWFATWNQQGTDQVEFVLHLGAKVRAEDIREMIPDPASLLKWLTKDRALLVIRDAADLGAKRDAAKALITEWIQHV